jgi:hypothetical protein
MERPKISQASGARASAVRLNPWVNAAMGAITTVAVMSWIVFATFGSTSEPYAR